MEQYREVFVDRRARALFLSAAVSGLGDWIGLAGLVVLAYQRSGSPIGAGALFAIQGGAAVAATVLLGPWLDRFERSRGLAATYAVGAAALLLPLVVGGLWPLLVTAGIVGALRPTAAALRHAIAGAELPPELLGPVVALQKATGDATAAVGLAAGGAVTVALGASLSLGLDAATFAVAAAMALTLPHSRGALDVRRGALVGAKLWLHDRHLRFLMLVLIVLAMVSALPETLAPAVAGDSGWLPAVLAAQAFGSAIGGVVLGHRDDLERSGPLVIGMAAVAVTLALGAAAALGHPVWLAVANLLLGLALGVGVLAQTAFTRSAPSDLLGAAVASAITAVLAAEGLGSLALGAIAERGGPEAGYAAAAAGVAVVAIALLRTVDDNAPTYPSSSSSVSPPAPTAPPAPDASRRRSRDVRT